MFLNKKRTARRLLGRLRDRERELREEQILSDDIMVEAIDTVSQSDDGMLSVSSPSPSPIVTRHALKLCRHFIADFSWDLDDAISSTRAHDDTDVISPNSIDHLQKSLDTLQKRLSHGLLGSRNPLPSSYEDSTHREVRIDDTSSRCELQAEHREYRPKGPVDTGSPLNDMDLIREHRRELADLKSIVERLYALTEDDFVWIETMKRAKEKVRKLQGSKEKVSVDEAAVLPCINEEIRRLESRIHEYAKHHQVGSGPIKAKTPAPVPVAKGPGSMPKSPSNGSYGAKGGYDEEYIIARLVFKWTTVQEFDGYKREKFVGS